MTFTGQRTPGYIDNSATGGKDQNSDLERTAGLGLLSQITDEASLRVNGLYANTQSDGIATVALDPVTMKLVTSDLTDQNARQAASFRSGKHSADNEAVMNVTPAGSVARCIGGRC